MSTIRIENLYKNYGAVPVLKDINLQIGTGEFVVFVGPSGCGKSTLLRCISGLEDISAGDIFIDDKKIDNVNPANRGIAMVFQNYALYPHMTVFKNIAYSLRVSGVPSGEQRERVTQVAKKLQLNDYLDRYPKELSGGQRQRVAIGRAIVRDPKVFLFDEPLSNLDAALRVQMRLELSDLKDQLPETTMIYVTHDQVEAMTMADKIVVLRGGVIAQIGSPMELYENPQCDFVAGFIGSPKMNFLGGRHAVPFDAARIGIRPEHLEIRGDGLWSGTVTHLERLGADSFIHLNIGENETMTVRVAGNSPLSQGETVAVGHCGPIHRFNGDGQSIGRA